MALAKTLPVSENLAEMEMGQNMRWARAHWALHRIPRYLSHLHCVQRWLDSSSTTSATLLNLPRRNLIPAVVDIESRTREPTILSDEIIQQLQGHRKNTPCHLVIVRIRHRQRQAFL